MNARILFLVGASALSGCMSERQSSSETGPPAREASTTASPWEQARERGIVFRGIGNEPGWVVEVGTGETPVLHAQLDYGERQIDVAHAQALPGGLGYAGTDGDGIDVQLQLRRGDCSDGMSDEIYPVSVQLVVGGKAYAGCGRFLQESR